MRRIFLLFLHIVVATGLNYGQGFYANIAGGQSSAMGSVFSGFGNNQEAVWLNPAAMANMNTLMSISAGASIPLSSTSFRMQPPSVYTASTEDRLTLPAYLYGSYEITDRFRVGLALNKPYSHLIKWQEENWAGRFIVKEMDFSLTIIQPAASFQLTESIAVGAGLVFSLADIRLRKALPVRDQNREGTANFSGTTAGMGFNAGILYNPVSWINLSASYKTGINSSFSKAKSSFSVPASLSGYFPENNPLTITYPVAANLSFNMGMLLRENFDLTLGISYIFSKNASDGTFDFETNTRHLSNFSIPRSERNDISYHLGAEYRITDYLHLRTGVYFRPENGNVELISPENPFGQHVALSGGISIAPLNGFFTHLGVVYMAGSEIEGQLEQMGFGGRYKTNVFIPTLGVSFDF